jgi:hypothetical protein
MLEQIELVHPALPDIAVLLLLLAASLAVYWFARAILVRAAHRAAGYTDHTWDDALIAHGVPGRLAQLLPVTIIYDLHHPGSDFYPDRFARCCQYDL